MTTKKELKRAAAKAQGPFISSAPRGKSFRAHVAYVRAQGTARRVARALKLPRDRILKLFQESVAKYAADCSDEHSQIYKEKHLSLAREKLTDEQKRLLDCTLAVGEGPMRLSCDAREVALEAFMAYAHELLTKSVLLAGVSRKRVVAPEHVATARVFMDPEAQWQTENFAVKTAAVAFGHRASAEGPDDEASKGAVAEGDGGDNAH